MVVGAVEHGDFPGWNPLLDQLGDSPSDEPGLSGVRLGGDQRRKEHPIPADRFEHFGELLFIGQNCRVRERENGRHAAVVRLDAKDLRARMLLGEAQDVFEIRAAPRVDALCIVAHHHDIAVPGGEHLNKFTLQPVRVLVFVDKDVAEQPLVARRDVRTLLEKRKRLGKQVIEIERVRLPLP